jgi:DNA-binding NarL/FixJ family response regulator
MPPRKMDILSSPEMSVSQETVERFKTLTPTERQVMRWIASGKTLKEIADTLGIKYKTVTVHNDNIQRKLGLGRSGMVDITRIWMQLGNTDESEFSEGGGI